MILKTISSLAVSSVVPVSSLRSNLGLSHLPAFSVEVEEEVGLTPDGGHVVDEVAEGDAVLQEHVDRKNEQLHAGVDR